MKLRSLPKYSILLIRLDHTVIKENLVRVNAIIITDGFIQAKSPANQNNIRPSIYFLK